MGKLLSVLVKVLTTLFLLVLVVAATLFFLVNPDRYRSGLQTSFEQRTGLQLDIAGELTLALRPRVSLTLEDIRIRSEGQPRELASAPQLVLDVDPWQLVQGHVDVAALRIDDLHVNLHADSGDISNWQNLQLIPMAEGSSSPEPDTSAAALLATIPVISLRNASIDIQNLAAPYQYSLRRLDLTARDANGVNRAFPVEASFDMMDGATGNPRPVRLSSTAAVDLDLGDLDLRDLQLTVTPLLLQGDVQFRDLGRNPSVSGKLTTASFNARDLLVNFGLWPAMDTETALTTLVAEPHLQTTLQVTFNADDRQLRIADLQLAVGEMRATGQTTVRYRDGFLPSVVSYELQTGALDFTPFFTRNFSSVQADEQTVSQSVPAANTADTGYWAQLRPWMMDTTVQGSIAIDSLRADDLTTGFVNVFTTLEDGVLDLETQSFNLLGGTVQSTLRVDGRADESVVNSRIRFDRVNMMQLPMPLLQPGTLAGLLTLEANLQSRGESLLQWLDNLNGNAAFRVTNNAVEIGLIKQVFTAIAALSPSGGAIQQWPDVIRVADFNGYVVLDGGLQNQQLQVRMDNFDIQGSGSVDVEARNFAYDLQFTVMGEPLVQTIPINTVYHNIHWPVQCAASFDADMSQLCRPDFPQVRSLFSALGNSETELQLAPRVAAERLPDAARVLLPNLFPETEAALP